MINKTALSLCLDVINIEKQGLDALMEHLKTPSISSSLETISNLILNTKGRVIVSGMGKSGIVGRKIAATFSSTGQPAFFVHPSEASHGDLGVIGRDDILFLLSNSGETKEMEDILYFGKRNNISVIAISSNPESMLNRLSTVSITIPSVLEACPMGLAPTTSTTLMMALGDALAITLLTWRGFTHKDFYKFHPGGKLGAQLKSVIDVMHKKNLPLVEKNRDMKECLIEMTKGGFGCVGVLDNDCLIGIITDGDLRRHMNDDILSKKAIDVMTKDPKIANPDMLVVEALNEMQTRSITSLFVVEEKKPIGFLHIHDFLRQGVI